MEKAVKLAIKGGWENPAYVNDNDGDETLELSVQYWQDTTMNPLFWKSLGKTLKWGNEKISFKVSKKEVSTYRGKYIRKAHTVTRPRYNRGTDHIWKIKWHNFIDALASGQSPNAFFKDLLSSKE